MTSAILLLLLGLETSAMRCADVLVTSGASKLDVLTQCGEPDFRERISGANQPSEEIWIYADTGRNVQRLLHFAGVELVSIRNTSTNRRREPHGAFRCGDELVLPGATKLEVRNKCGEPAIVEQTSGDDETRWEIWLYSRQSNRQTVRLEFAGVELQQINYDDR